MQEENSSVIEWINNNDYILGIIPQVKFWKVCCICRSYPYLVQQIICSLAFKTYQIYNLVTFTLTGLYIVTAINYMQNSLLCSFFNFFVDFVIKMDLPLDGNKLGSAFPLPVENWNKNMSSGWNIYCKKDSSVHKVCAMRSVREGWEHNDLLYVALFCNFARDCFHSLNLWLLGYTKATLQVMARFFSWMHLILHFCKRLFLRF